MGGWCGDEPGCSRELASQLPVLHRLLLSHRWNRAKLLQHPQLVMVRPMLDQVPIDKTTDVNLRPGCLLAGGGSIRNGPVCVPVARQRATTFSSSAIMSS